MSDFIIDESKRIILGELIRKNRIEKGLGLNQMALKIDLTKSLLSKLENGQTQKVNPFLLKKVAHALKMDYKILYKIVGYLDEEDLSEKNSMNNNNSVGFMGNTGNIHINHLNIRNGLASSYTENEIIDKINALPREFQKDIFEFIDFKYMMYEKERKG